MPIHNSMKVAFIHIPKTGGTTLEKIIKAASGNIAWEFWGKIHDLKHYRLHFPGRPDISRISPDRELFNSTYKEGVYHHLVYRDIERAYDVNLLLGEGYSFVTIYRNPFDRLVSLYEYGKQTGGRMLTANKTFAEWFYDRPVSPQSHGYLIDEQGKFPPHLKILDFNNFAEQVSSYLEDIGAECESIPHEKKTERKHWTEYYTKAMIDHLNTECAQDIRLGEELGFFNQPN